MSSLINATKFALLLLCLAGYYCTWHLLMNNGTTEHMSHIRGDGPQKLPGTNEPLKTIYTGIPAIDNQLTVLALFYWEVVDGSHPAASLFCFHFATQLACGWGLLMVEGLRRGHRRRIISFIGTLGILVQNAAYAVVIPLYLITYLSTSPLIGSKQVSDYLVRTTDVAAIPFSVALGHALPAVLMSLPAPSIISSEKKQIFMAIWQMFPLCVAILQAILPHTTAAFTRSKTKTRIQSHEEELSSLRRLYSILLVVAGIGQVSTFTLLATSTWFPNLFAPEYVGVFNPSKVFVPMAVSPSTRMPSIGAGALLLLQYDELIGSMSMALFATVLYTSAYHRSKPRNSPTTLVTRGIAVLILTGPLGYAVACIWARDELIAAESQGDSKKSH